MEIKEKKDNALRWEATGLLKGIEDDYVKVEVAELLENQRQHNASYKGDDTALFKRLSIPLVRRAFSESFIGWNIVSVQAVTHPTPMVYNADQYGNLKEVMISCKSRNLGTYVPLVKALGEIDESKYVKISDGLYLEGPLTKNWISSQNNLSEEAEITAWVSSQLCNELNSEIIRDLTNNAKTNIDYEWKNKDHFSEALVMLSAVCERECQKKVNWFVISENLVKTIESQEGFVVSEKSVTSPCCEVRKYGMLRNRWTIYSDSSTEDKVLCGYKGRHYDAGYQYCPYVPLSEMEQVLKEENISRKRFSTRYGKRLWDNSFYATMKVNGFRSEEKEQDVNV